jgi:hypothetical protein
MNIGRTIIRRVIWILTGLAVYAVLGLFSGKAHAQMAECASSTEKCDRAQASQRCEADKADQIAAGRSPIGCDIITESVTSGQLECRYIFSGSTKSCREPRIITPNRRYYWAVACKNGGTWDQTTKTCHDPTECLAKNRPSMEKTQVTQDLVQCEEGCAYKMQDQPITTTLYTAGGTVEKVIYEGYMAFTGEVCPSNAPPALPPVPQFCTPVAGQTLCIKQNGDHCTAVSGTRHVCFKPTETGPKTDGPKLVERLPGPDAPSAPQKMPPPGETFNKEGNSYRSTTTNNNLTTTTNTSIYNTTNGTNAAGPGGTDSGTPSTGTGSGGEGNEGNEGTASGGGDCDSPPIVSGDQVLAMVATQSWATRCAVEAGNAAGVTGDIGDCNSSFSVEGTTANAEQLRALRAQICPNEGDGESSVDQSGIAGDGDATSLGFIAEGTEFGTDGLNIAGFGYSRSCPAMPTISVFGQSIQFDNSVMCNWLQLAGALVLVLAALASIRILSGGV